MISLDLFSAFVAGILSFFSPCILPLLPSYLSVITGYSLQDRASGFKWNAVAGAVFFGLGFSIVFILMGAISTGIGRFLITYQEIIYTVLGIVVILLGLHMLGLLRFKFLYNEKKIHIDIRKKDRHRYWQAFLIGFAFAFGWTPCVGPVLGAILTMAAQKEQVAGGMILLAAYSLGLWIPFLLTAIFTVPILSTLSKYPKIALRAQQAAGVLLVLMGILLITGQMSRISAMLS